MKFESKKDSWVRYLLAAIFGFVVASIYILPGEKEIPIWVHVLIIASFVLVYWMYLATFTTVKDGILKHQTGPMSWTVPVENIKKIKRKSTNAVNHGTWSSDKMDIIHKRGTLSIAPEDKNELIVFLKKRNSNIEILD